jgi:hypothetical protein
LKERRERGNDHGNSRRGEDKETRAITIQIELEEKRKIEEPNRSRA